MPAWDSIHLDDAPSKEAEDRPRTGRDEKAETWADPDVIEGIREDVEDRRDEK